MQQCFDISHDRQMFNFKWLAGKYIIIRCKCDQVICFTALHQCTAKYLMSHFRGMFATCLNMFVDLATIQMDRIIQCFVLGRQSIFHGTQE